MVVATYNNASQHETTGFSPYFLMYGRENKTPLDLTLGIPTDAVPLDESEYVHQLRERIQTAYEVVTKHVQTKTQRIKLVMIRRFIHISWIQGISSCITVLDENLGDIRN